MAVSSYSSFLSFSIFVQILLLVGAKFAMTPLPYDQITNTTTITIGPMLYGEYGERKVGLPAQLNGGEGRRLFNNTSSPPIAKTSNMALSNDFAFFSTKGSIKVFHASNHTLFYSDNKTHFAGGSIAASPNNQWLVTVLHNASLIGIFKVGLTSLVNTQNIITNEGQVHSLSMNNTHIVALRWIYEQNKNTYHVFIDILCLENITWKITNTSNASTPIYRQDDFQYHTMMIPSGFFAYSWMANNKFFAVYSWMGSYRECNVHFLGYGLILLSVLPAGILDNSLPLLLVASEGGVGTGQISHLCRQEGHLMPLGRYYNMRGIGYLRAGSYNPFAVSSDGFSYTAQETFPSQWNVFPKVTSYILLKSPPGMFSTMFQPTQHVPCFPGTFKPNATAAMCSLCHPGTYQPKWGQTECISCHSTPQIGNSTGEYYCPIGSTRKFLRSQFAAGTFNKRSNQFPFPISKKISVMEDELLINIWTPRKSSPIFPFFWVGIGILVLLIFLFCVAKIAEKTTTPKLHFFPNLVRELDPRKHYLLESKQLVRKGSLIGGFCTCYLLFIGLLGIICVVQFYYDYHPIYLSETTCSPNQKNPLNSKRQQNLEFDVYSLGSDNHRVLQYVRHNSTLQIALSLYGLRYASGDALVLAQQSGKFSTTPVCEGWASNFTLPNNFLTIKLYNCEIVPKKPCPVVYGETVTVEYNQTMDQCSIVFTVPPQHSFQQESSLSVTFSLDGRVSFTAASVNVSILRSEHKNIHIAPNFYVTSFLGANETCIPKGTFFHDIDVGYILRSTEPEKTDSQQFITQTSALFDAPSEMYLSCWENESAWFHSINLNEEGNTFTISLHERDFYRYELEERVYSSAGALVAFTIAMLALFGTTQLIAILFVWGTKLWNQVLIYTKKQSVYRKYARKVKSHTDYSGYFLINTTQFDRESSSSSSSPHTIDNSSDEEYDGAPNHSTHAQLRQEIQQMVNAELADAFSRIEKLEQLQVEKKQQ